MAIIKNALVQQASGSVGKQVVYKKYYDKTVMSKMPDMSNRVLSEKQVESNERMKLANLYARYIYSTEEGKIKARTRLKLPAHKSLYHALVKEHLDQNRYLPLQEVEDALGSL
jgi:ABC-type sulfate transport system substrate-binding protein